MGNEDMPTPTAGDAHPRSASACPLPPASEGELAREVDAGGRGDPTPRSDGDGRGRIPSFPMAVQACRTSAGWYTALASVMYGRAIDLLSR